MLYLQYYGVDLYCIVLNAQLYTIMGACGLVDRALDSRSEGLGFDSHCWSCVEVSGKLFIPYCLWSPSSDGYLVERKIVNGISCRECAAFSPEEMRPYKREFQYQGCKLKSPLNSREYQTINIYIYIYTCNYLTTWLRTCRKDLYGMALDLCKCKLHGIVNLFIMQVIWEEHSRFVLLAKCSLWLVDYDWHWRGSQITTITNKKQHIDWVM